MSGRDVLQEMLPPNDLTLVSATTVDEDTDLPAGCRGLLVGTAGALSVVMKDGSTLSAVPFQAGINPGFFVEIKTLGSTAENVWAIT